MRAWELHLSLDAPRPAPHRRQGAAAEPEALPLFLRIARAISDDIRRGRLRPGDALPGSRRLSQTLGVHRNTVVAAYQELLAEGFLSAEPARGTFVSAALPDPAPAARPHPRPTPRATAAMTPGFDVGDSDEDEPEALRKMPEGLLALAGGLPDLRLSPSVALARAYRRVLLARGGQRLLSYGDPQGHPRLRAALVEMLATTRGLVASPDALLLTRGSQMALFLVARTLIAPGDRVAVEALGYRPAWEAFRQAGARLCPIPVDQHGLDVDALEALCERRRLRAVYLTPHHQYPTTVTLPAARRIRLLALARRHRLLVVEDDYDHEFHYEGRPVLPLASSDGDGVVVYVGTLSKIVAPGLRIGYVVAPGDLARRMAARRVYIDRQGDQATECAVASLFEDGELQRSVRRNRRIYRARRDVLVDALEKNLGGALELTRPQGGIALWAAADPRVDVDALAARCLEKGVLFQTAKRFAYDGRPRPFLRLGFAACDERELREAVRRIAAVWPR